MTYDPRRDSLDPEFRPLPPEARGPEYDGGVSTNVSAILLVAILVIGGLFAFYYYGSGDNTDRTTTGSTTKTEQSMPSGQAPLGSPPNSPSLQKSPSDQAPKQ